MLQAVFLRPHHVERSLRDAPVEPHPLNRTLEDPMFTEQRITELERMLQESREAALRVWERAEHWRETLTSIRDKTTDDLAHTMAKNAILNSK